MKTKKFRKNDIVNKIYKSLDSIIPRKYIKDAIDVISEYIVDTVKENNSISVNNFGTFSPSRSGIKFRPHVNLLSLIKQKRKKFQKTS